MTWLTCCLSVNPRLMVALVCINNIWLTHWNLGFHSLFRVYKSDTQMKLELPVFERYAILKNKKRERERTGTVEIKTLIIIRLNVLLPKSSQSTRTYNSRKGEKE